MSNLADVLSCMRSVRGLIDYTTQTRLNEFHIGSEFETQIYLQITVAQVSYLMERF